MKELDFDELDRAVNSLMNGVKTAKPPKKQDDDTKTLTIDPKLQDGAKPNFAALHGPAQHSVTDNKPPQEKPASKPAEEAVEPQSPVQSPTSEPAATPTAPTPSVAAKPTPPATRRGGRFMDVVHPSSDMKPAAKPVSRTGATIEPTESVSAPANDDTPAETTPLTEPVKPTTPPPTASSNSAAETPTTTPVVPAGDWPDPLDMANFGANDDDKAEATAAPVIPDSPNEATTATSSTSQRTPLTSPFLSGTKVEKRPLGAAPADEQPAEEPGRTSADADTEESSTATSSDLSAQLPAEPSDVETPLPEELRSDLMAIESGSHTGQKSLDDHETPTENTASQPEVTASTSATPPRQPETAPAGSSPAPPETTQVPPTSAPVAPAKEAAVTTGPTSITQQYREEPSTGDQTNGAIYDTEAYHQPLAHPAQKKSGWMWVVWIVLILLVGAGGGAALYFLGLV